MNSKIQVLAIMGAVLAMFGVAIVGPVAATGSYSPAADATSAENVTLTEGQTTDYTFQTDDTNAKDVIIKDANGNQLAENAGVATTTDADGNDIVETSFNDSDLINHANYPVEAGDELTIEVYDSTDTATDQTLTQTVSFVSDEGFIVTDSVVTDDANFGINSDEGIFMLVDAYDVADVNHEFVFDDSDMDQDERTAVLEIEDSEVLNQFDAAQTDRGILGSEEVANGEEIEADATVEGEEVDVFLNEAPEDHDGTHTLVYNASDEQLELTTTSESQGLNTSVSANQFKLFDYDFEWPF